MCSRLWKFNSDGFCPSENANPSAGSRVMPRWDMKNLGEKYRVSSWEIHINEPVTNTKSVCEKCNSTDQRRDVGMDRNTQATTKNSAKCEHKYTNANTQIQLRKYKYRHKYKYAVTTAVARSFRKLNSDGFWLLRNANRSPRSGVMPVWLFSSGIPSCGWRLLSRWKVEKI